MKSNHHTKMKRGGVSIFVVSITCILIAIIAVSFVRLMIRDQQQAIKQDLSQSAYDSAQAGVEDAKRFLSVYHKECVAGSNLTSSKCQSMDKEMKKGEHASCNMMHTAGIGAATGETVLQTSTTAGRDTKLDQAYTCVKINRQTADFLGDLSEGDTKVIPLKSATPFQKVVLSWFSPRDLSEQSGNIDLERINFLSAGSSNNLLISKLDWNRKVNRPPVMKTQFFSYAKNQANTFETLENSSVGNGNGTSERLYYPATGAGAKSNDTLPLHRRQGSLITDNISPVLCESRMVSGYACKVEIQLHSDGSDVNTDTNQVYMRLTPIYKATSFRIGLLDKMGNVVNFDGIQPKVDSTGRANDLFRRIESRIEPTNDAYLLPEFSLQIDDASRVTCKDFWTTNLRNQFNSCR